MPHQPPRTKILRSSYEAMQYDCPLGHGVAGTPCADKYHDMMDSVVCPERRALVTIYAPGQYVTWNGRPVI